MRVYIGYFTDLKRQLSEHKQALALPMSPLFTKTVLLHRCLTLQVTLNLGRSEVEFTGVPNMLAIPSYSARPTRYNLLWECGREQMILTPAV